jgi:hypothetical protein
MFIALKQRRSDPALQGEQPGRKRHVNRSRRWLRAFMGLGLIVMSSAVAAPSANANAIAIHAVGGGVMVGAQDQATGLGPMRTVVIGYDGASACSIDPTLWVKQGGALIARPLTWNSYYGVYLNQTAYGALLDAYVWVAQCNGSQWLYQISAGNAANGWVVGNGVTHPCQAGTNCNLSWNGCTASGMSTTFDPDYGHQGWAGTLFANFTVDSGSCQIYGYMRAHNLSNQYVWGQLSNNGPQQTYTYATFAGGPWWRDTTMIYMCKSGSCGPITYVDHGA